jgi:hypothetical protein
VLFEETPEILADKRPARDVWNKIPSYKRKKKRRPVGYPEAVDESKC